MSEVAIEIQRTEVSALAAMTREETDIQISTAKRYPRDLVKFERASSAMVTSTEEFAGKCLYAIPRGGKIIVGPSVRFAEVIAHTWGNIRSGGRVIEEQDKYVVAQGVCFDLEQNVAITFEVKRKIVDRDGVRYNADMIGNTGNAAVAIALRNSVLRVVPKSFWGPVFDKVTNLIGDPRDLPRWRSAALDWFEKHHKANPHDVCRIVQVDNPDSIGVDQIIQLRGIRTALEENDVTIDEVLRHAKRIPSAPRRASEVEHERKVEAKVDRKAKGSKRGKSKAIDPAVAETTALAVADADKKSARGVQQTVASIGTKINEKERVDMFRIVSDRGFQYEQTKAIVKKVLERFRFGASEFVVKEKYQEICGILRTEPLPK